MSFVEIKFDWQASGIFRFMDDPKAVELFKRAIKKCQKAAFVQWVHRSSPGLADRFEQGRAQRLGLAARGWRYDALKRKRTGRVDPFVSPRAKGISMKQQLLGQRRYRILSPRTAGALDVRTALTLTGARVLNLMKGRGKVHRKQFLRLEHPTNAQDTQWILERTAELAWYELRAITDRLDKRALRLGRRLSREALGRRIT